MLVNLKTNNTPATKIPTTKFRLYLADMADVDVENWPTPVVATISTNVLTATKTWKYVDCKINTLKPNAAPGESPLTGKLTINAQLDGLTKENLDWLYGNNGRRVIAVWERCSDGQKFIGGSPCSGGVEIRMASIGDLDGGASGVGLTLEGGDCPEPIYYYDATGEDFPVAPDA